jgi:Tfp pilus assembly protein PilX
MFRRIHEDERGMAMIVALMVSFAVLLLSTVVVAQSIHSLDSSGYDRKRLLAVNAAEAGTNDYYEFFQTNPLSVVKANCMTPRTGTITSEPLTSTYTARVTFYNAAGTAFGNCSTFTDVNLPATALINSVGVAGTGNIQVARTFQTYVRLSPIRGGFDAAVLSNTGAVTFGNNFNIYGNNGNNGDVYVLSGNYTQTNTVVVRGNVYVPNGSATMSNSAQIQGSLWSNGSATVTTVTGDVTSSTGNIAGGTIGGNAKAAGTITGTVAGTRSPNTAGIPTPPTQTFPQITFNSTDWTNAGYTINTYSGAGACTNARAFVEGSWTGNYVVRITGATSCTYTNSVTNPTITLNGNLAIISDWAINISNQSNWNGATTTRNLYFISTWASPLNCATANKNVSTGNNTNFNSLVHVFFYTPCTLTLANQNAFEGQALGSPVNITNQFNMTYQQVLVPGQGTVTGFQQDIAYTREVRNA